MSKDQRLLEKAYSEVLSELLTEYQLPSSRFRSKTYSENRVFYRLYVKLIKDSNQPFRWAGEFGSKEKAIEAFNSGHNLGEFKTQDYEYIIKEIKISYSEKNIDQSSIIDLRNKLPELKGVF